MHLFTDASGSKGWKAFWTNKWLQAEWSSEQVMHNMVWKELLFNYMLLCAQSIQGATTEQGKRFHVIVITALHVVCKESTHCYCRELMTLVRTLI